MLAATKDTEATHGRTQKQSAVSEAVFNCQTAYSTVGLLSANTEQVVSRLVEERERGSLVRVVCEVGNVHVLV